MPLSSDGTIENSVIADLYKEAVRQGQSLWFRVTSGSMHPLLRVGEQVYIEPAKADQLQIGDIAAFETFEGLVIHRIVQRQHNNQIIQLLEMSDVHLRVEQVESSAVIGRVVAIGSHNQYINLQRSIAQKCARVTARVRYRSYTMRPRNKLAQVLIGKYARLVARLASWYTRRFCASSPLNMPPHPASN